jgi:hypothetical protein
VKLDGKIQKWSNLALAREKDIDRESMEKRDFVYLKYWKPLGMYQDFFAIFHVVIMKYAQA